MTSPISPKFNHLKLTPQQLPSTLKKAEGGAPTGRSTHTILSVEGEEEDDEEELPR